VDSRRRGAFDRKFKKKQFLFFCLFITVGDPEGEQKLDGSQNATKLYSSYLFII